MNDLGTKRTAALGFIVATALMDVISLGIMIPVLPNLVKEMVGGDTATASLYAGAFGTAWALMQFLVAPIMGLVSDRFGRRPVLLVSIAGLGIDFLFMALAPTLGILFVGRLINGITAASFSTAGAYVADVTPPEGRAKAFGMIGAAWSLGFVIGPAIGGFLGDINLRLPFYVAAAMALLNWLYGMFVLPESLPPEKRTKTLEWSKANPIGALQFLNSRPGLLAFAPILFLFQLAHNVLPAIFVLYTGHRYHWGPGMVGLMLVATGLVGILVQALLVGPVVDRFGERGAVLIGLACGALGFVVYGYAPTPFVYWLGLPIFAGMGFTQPGLQGLMTRRVGPHEQGRLQGVGSSIQGLTGMIGPVLFTSTFAWAVRHEQTLHMPGIPIFFAALFLGIAWVISYFVAWPVAPKSDGTPVPASVPVPE